MVRGNDGCVGVRDVLWWCAVCGGRKAGGGGGCFGSFCAASTDAAVPRKRKERVKARVVAARPRNANEPSSLDSDNFTGRPVRVSQVSGLRVSLVLTDSSSDPTSRPIAVQTTRTCKPMNRSMPHDCLLRAGWHLKERDVRYRYGKRALSTGILQSNVSQDRAFLLDHMNVSVKISRS